MKRVTFDVNKEADALHDKLAAAAEVEFDHGCVYGRLPWAESIEPIRAALRAAYGAGREQRPLEDPDARRGKAACGSDAK